MDITKNCRSFVFDCLRGAPTGPKVLLVDDESARILSLIVSQSELLAHEVYLVQRIRQLQESNENLSQQNDRTATTAANSDFPHLKAICFLRPEPTTLLRLAKELKNPHFKEYYLCFTASIPEEQVDRLAKCDVMEAVQEMKTGFVDFHAVAPTIFSLGLEAFATNMHRPVSQWQTVEDAQFKRCCEGLLATAVCVFNGRARPVVKYQANFEICRKLALFVHDALDREAECFQADCTTTTNRPLLVIIDRREDPVTPILNQWTYHAMLHELVGIDDNSVDLSKVDNVVRSEGDSVFVVARQQDAFFDKHALSNFGDLGQAINSYVQDYQAKTKNTADLNSLEAMKNFVENYPEYRKLSGNVVKHVSIVHFLSKFVASHGLFDTSELEQSIACTENMAEHQRRLFAILSSRGKTSNFDKLRLAMLFCLRYEPDASILDGIRRELQSSGVDEKQIVLITTLLSFAGSAVRQSDIFSKRDFLAVARNRVARQIQGVENVYTQHKSVLSSILERIVKRGTATELSSLSKEQRAEDAGPPTEGILVFIIGGATFAEARDTEIISSNSRIPIVIGGTTILNSRKFLADVSTLESRVYGQAAAQGVGDYQWTPDSGSSLRRNRQSMNVEGTLNAPEDWRDSIFATVNTQGRVFSGK